MALTFQIGNVAFSDLDNSNTGDFAKAYNESDTYGFVRYHPDSVNGVGRTHTGRIGRSILVRAMIVRASVDDCYARFFALKDAWSDTEVDIDCPDNATTRTRCILDPDTMRITSQPKGDSGCRVFMEWDAQFSSDA